MTRHLLTLFALLYLVNEWQVLAAGTKPESVIVAETEFLKFGPAAFTMGCCPQNVPEIWKKDFVEYPATNAFVRQFLFARTTVTVQDYCEFLNAKGFNPTYTAQGKLFKFIKHKDGKYAPRAKNERKAVGGITFSGATAYCEWFSQVSGYACRLPSSAEWEFVARGKERRTYPWGDTATRDFPTEAIPGTRTDLATPEGIFDLVGAVYQWCSDDAPPSVSGRRMQPLRKVLRGGALIRMGFINEKLHAPPNWRWFASRPEDTDTNVGIRIVLEPKLDK